MRRALPSSPPQHSSVGGARPIGSNVYERERTVTETVVKPQGPRIKRDRLLDVFSDWNYHSAYDLEHLDGFDPGDWVVEVRALIEYGFAFGRRGNSLIMRHRPLSERTQDLAELLAGIDAREPEDANPLQARADAEADVLARHGMGPPVVRPENTQFEPAYDQRSDYDEPDTAVDESGASDFNPTGDVVPPPDENDRLVLSLDLRAGVFPAKTMVTSTMAFLAQKRQGKTYLGMVLCEELLKRKLPFVAIDPTGVWYGLRSKVDGTPADNEILQLGGKHGHWKLPSDSGAAVASLVIELWPRPVILDLSDMEPEEQHIFVAGFGNQIYVSNKKPLHLFFDEADEFAPQTPDSTYKHQRRCLNVIDRLVRRGGVKGIGATLITQRSAVINKNVLSQVGRLMVLKMVAPHDLTAVEDWMKPVVTSATDRIQCISSIPRLAKGEVFCIQNEAGAPPLTKFMVRPKETYNSSRTPTMDEPEPPEPGMSSPPRETITRAGYMLGHLEDDKVPEDADVGDADGSDGGDGSGE
jgi:hypothetical protein